MENNAVYRGDCIRTVKQFMELILINRYDSEAIPIGVLSYEYSVYRFRYFEKCRADLPDGFYKVSGFDDMNPERVYESDRLFWVFADRMTPRSRPDFNDRLKKLGMTEFDEWEYLKRSGLRRMTDGYELIEPEKMDNIP